MATPIIDATIGGVNANSFGTLIEADTYHDTVLHPDAPWVGADAVKIPALIMAQQQMTALICWTGFITSITQKLPWPRIGMWARNPWVYIQQTVIPDEVKWCQFELARLFIDGDRTVEFDVDTNGLIQLRAGPVTMKFKDRYNPGPPVIPSVAYNLLVPTWYDDITDIRDVNLDLERA